MIQRWIAACLLAASINTNALELELGIAKTHNPFYTNVSERLFPDQYDNRLIGKIGIEHTFELPYNLGIKVFGTHYSLAFEKEPNQVSKYQEGAGLDMLGISITYKLF